MRILICLCVFMCLSCKKRETTPGEEYIWDALLVTATAYNSLAYQTDLNPHITAFGDSLKPGLKYIAVSRDLLKMGLKHNTPVKDKMHPRWRKSIDIYMGEDVKAAKTWGRKRVCIEYGLPKAAILTSLKLQTK